MNISGTGRAGHLIEVLRAGVRRSVHWLIWGFVALLVLLSLYLALAVGGSLVPSNASWTPPRQGVRIFIYTNGVHSGIVLPTANDLQDWRQWVNAEDIGDPRYAASSHILFGWGERGFYLNTPRWSDLRPGVAARALLGGNSTLLHVDHVHAPKPSSDMRPLMISEDQYRELVRRIAGYFRLDATGRVQSIKGYGPADAFYESNGRYGPIRTCNEWTGAQLRGIGVRVGVWTPFSRSVMRWFDAAPR